MKAVLKTTFTVVGSVIGAGFISGRELVRFFGGEAFFPVLLLTACLFFLYFYFLFSFGTKYGSLDGFLNGVFPKFSVVIRVSFLICSFVTVTAMLAGVNALQPKFSPYIAILTAIFSFFTVKKGIDGLHTVNAVLVPAIVVYVVVSLLLTGNFTLANSLENSGMGIVFCVLYVCMNGFLSAPVIIESGAKLTHKKQIVLSSLLATVLIVACMALILAAIGATPGAAERVMPLVFVLKEGKLFLLCSFLGIITTLISAYYPLHTAVKGVKIKEAARLLILSAASLFACWGLDKIVETVYPVIGILGVFFLIASVLYDQFFQKHH
ncbi:MAG: hypothetical protein IKC91_03695 [Clostridia bacterium]|nr:hypothetical protein [Clostridia bacterium]